MKQSKEQLDRLLKKLPAAKSAEEIMQIAKESGREIPVDDAARFLEKRKTGQEALTDETLAAFYGGFGTDSVPHYQDIKDCFIARGANQAFTLCIYYIPSPLCEEIVELCEEELAAGIY